MQSQCTTEDNAPCSANVAAAANTGYDYERIVRHVKQMIKDGVPHEDIRHSFSLINSHYLNQGGADEKGRSTTGATEHQIDSNSPCVVDDYLLEAIFLGVEKKYIQIKAMQKAGVPNEAIHHKMTFFDDAAPSVSDSMEPKEEAVDPEEKLMKAIIFESSSANGTCESSGKEEDPQLGDLRRAPAPPMLNEQDQHYHYSALRAVKDMIHIDRANKMRKASLPHGAIRQRLLLEGASESFVSAILAVEVPEDEKGVWEPNLSFDSEDGNSNTDTSFCDSEISHDSADKLRTAVFRRVRELVEEGKSDSDIRHELIGMRGVDKNLVEDFLEMQVEVGVPLEVGGYVGDAIPTISHRKMAYVKKIQMMRRVGIPTGAIRQKLRIEKIHDDFVDSVLDGDNVIENDAIPLFSDTRPDIWSQLKYFVVEGYTEDEVRDELQDLGIDGEGTEDWLEKYQRLRALDNRL